MAFDDNNIYLQTRRIDMQRDIISIRPIQKSDISIIVAAFNESLGGEFENYITRCFDENGTQTRITYVAFYNNDVAGYVNIIFKSSYPYFLERNIPEINDLRVISKYRRNGIGKMLIDQCESHASVKYDYIGLGVGLYKDYGSAQRLYTKNGYVLDGNGLMYKNVEVKPGNDVFVDDDLLLYLYKRIR
jgi:GNAT superfamily N-acetyltransferase